MAKVKANRFFQTEAIGAKQAGDEFDYDVQADPQKLVALGYVDHGKAAQAEQPKDK